MRVTTQAASRSQLVMHRLPDQLGGAAYEQESGQCFRTGNELQMAGRHDVTESDRCDIDKGEVELAHRVV